MSSEIKQGIALGFTIVAVVAGVFTARSAQATLPVIDPINLIQNTLQVQSETMTQVNTYQSTVNQAKMLANTDINTFQDAISQMRRAQGLLSDYCIDVNLVPGRIGYGSFENPLTCNNLIGRVNIAYPDQWQAHRLKDMQEKRQEWVASQRDAAIDAMNAQNETGAAMEKNAERMEELASENQTVEGQKAAVQVTNEMLSTVSGQIQDLHATQIAHQRQEAIDRAEDASARERAIELRRRAREGLTSKGTTRRVKYVFSDSY